MSARFQAAVAGGGTVGLACALLLNRRCDWDIALVERSVPRKSDGKEPQRALTLSPGAVETLTECGAGGEGVSPSRRAGRPPSQVRLRGGLDQDAAQLAVLHDQVVGPLQFHVVGYEGLQALGNRDAKRQREGAVRGFWRGPAHTEQQSGACGRMPTLSVPPPPRALMAGDAYRQAVGSRCIGSLQQPLVGGRERIVRFEQTDSPKQCRIDRSQQYAPVVQDLRPYPPLLNQ